MTACRQTLEDCQRLEDGALYGGIAGIVDGSLTHVCREVRGEHPGDALGGRERWERSKKAGSWVSLGSCRLEGAADASPWPGARDFEHHRIVFGGLRLGQTPAEVEAILGPPPFPARPVEDDHYIYWLEWDYSSGWGLELKFRGPKKSGPFRLDYIRATAPCTFRTEKGIGIGDHETAPGKVYVNPHDFIDAEPGELVPDLGPDWTHVPSFHADPDTHLIDEIIIDADGC